MNNSNLEGQRLTLRGFNTSDANDVYKYCSNPQVTKYLSFETHLNIDTTYDALDNILIKPHSFAITLKDSNQVIGSIGLSVDNSNNKAEVGYVIDIIYWNKGYASEALNIILDYAFNKLNLNRVEALHYQDNIASGKVMLKNNFLYEGCLVDYYFLKNKYQTCLIYGITRKDFLK